MKNLILRAVFFLTTIGFAQDGRTITVTVDNVPNANGKVAFALHTKNTFMKTNAIMNLESTIKGSIATVIFNDVKPGEYAILVLHDENGNNRMDYRENGMPLEAFGASNNVMDFGPPQYEDVKFTVAEDDLDINIRF